jgi:hypothetical protein
MVGGRVGAGDAAALINTLEMLGDIDIVAFRGWNRYHRLEVGVANAPRDRVATGALLR